MPAKALSKQYCQIEEKNKNETALPISNYSHLQNQMVNLQYYCLFLFLVIKILINLEWTLQNLIYVDPRDM